MALRSFSVIFFYVCQGIESDKSGYERLIMVIYPQNDKIQLNALVNCSATSKNHHLERWKDSGQVIETKKLAKYSFKPSLDYPPRSKEDWWFIDKVVTFNLLCLNCSTTSKIHVEQ